MPENVSIPILSYVTDFTSVVHGVCKSVPVMHLSFLSNYQARIGGEDWNGVHCLWIPFTLWASGHLFRLLFSSISPAWQYQTHSFKTQDTGLSKHMNKEEQKSQQQQSSPTACFSSIRLTNNWKSCYFRSKWKK